jgi:hypothetical protein
MIRSEGGDWQIEVFRDLEGIVRAWELRDRTALATGVVHVGFERDPTRSFDGIAAQFPNLVLLTASAKYALPSGFQSSAEPIGATDSQPVYLATRGWGYEAEDVQKPRAAAARPAFADWVAGFVQKHPEYSEELVEAGLLDERGYSSAEASLAPELRRLLGLFRFDELIGDRRDDPCGVARVAPPWLRSREFTKMEITVRLDNVFKASKIQTVADLEDHSLTALLKLPNFGRKSVDDLLSCLADGLRSGPVAVGTGADAIQRGTLIGAIHQSLSSCNARERDVLTRRMGLSGKPETLAEIGDAYQITRERIRQIEAKTVARIQRQELWSTLLSDKFSRLLRGREFPLPLLGIEAIDAWFLGVAESTFAIHYVLEHMCKTAVRIIEVDGVEYLAFIDQTGWDGALQEARRLLSSGASQNWTEQHCRSLVLSVLPDEASEFRSLLWDKASALCHFSQDPSGESVLRSYGRGADPVVQAVLQEADRPLHFTEIAELASARAKRPLDIRRAHNAAAAVGVLLGRGVYGVDKHLPLDAARMKALGDEAMDLIAEGAPGRQWHSAEILGVLVDRGSRHAAIADKYVVDVALQRCGQLESLGRMVWSQPSSADTEAARVEVRQAVTRLVRQAGRPLPLTEIRQRLVAIRGTGANFQLGPYADLIRVGPALWGLNDRDLTLKKSDQPEFLEQVFAVLEERQVGIHASELWTTLRVAPEMTAEAIFSVASQDARLHVSVGQYLHLRSWGGPRRESVNEAAAAVLQIADQPLPFDTIVRLIDERTSRSCDRRAVSASLQGLGASLDSSGCWAIAPDASMHDDAGFELAVGQ